MIRQGVSVAEERSCPLDAPCSATCVPILPIGTPTGISSEYYNNTALHLPKSFYSGIEPWELAHAVVVRFRLSYGLWSLEGRNRHRLFRLARQTLKKMLVCYSHNKEYCSEIFNLAVTHHTEKI
jgi:hypothetical protein